MPVGSGLPRLNGYPFEVRYSDGSRARAKAAADIAADAYAYFGRLFSPAAPDIALIVADARDWPGGGCPTACRTSAMTRASFALASS